MVNATSHSSYQCRFDVSIVLLLHFMSDRTWVKGAHKVLTDFLCAESNLSLAYTSEQGIYRTLRRLHGPEKRQVSPVDDNLGQQPPRNSQKVRLY